MTGPIHLRSPGPALALLSALLFGASTPLAKLLLGELSPLVLAGLLYSGSGLGLCLIRLLGPRGGHEAPVSRTDVPWLAGAVLLGGIAAPVLLLTGLGESGAALAVGLLGYGISLVLFVLALRHLGTARTGAYFSLAPFFGAAASLLLLHESVGAGFVAAALLMAAGVWLHLTERHDHEHTHDRVEHAHSHVHDDHHDHDHSPGTTPGEPHSHAHSHAPLTHAHPHYPDTHHRHDH